MRNSVACASSMIVHMLLLILLGLWANDLQKQDQGPELIATIEERPDEKLHEVLEQEITPSKTLDAVSTAMAATGAMGQVAVSVAPQVRYDNNVTVPNEIRAEPGELNIFNTTGKAIARDVPSGTLGQAMAEAKDYQDALDRITAEILAKLAHSKVLVLWCFDQSESMLDDRQEIMSRIGRVYEELNVAESAQGDAVLTAVTSFGHNHKLHTPKPTASVDEIKAAMNSVELDPTGDEMLCHAIGYSVGYHHKFATTGRRQLMCIVVTDESGDPETNWTMMEATIAECKSARCPVYFLGRESVFGYPYAHMSYIHPENKSHHWLRIDRGPETPYAEQLQVDGIHRRYDAHASGFGPYAQTRIARETGGIFFMLPSPEVRLVHRDTRKYEFETMRPYLPDLSSREDYSSERDKHEMRKILWQVILALNPYEPGREKEVQIRTDNYPVGEAEFVARAKRDYLHAQHLIGIYQTAKKELTRVEPLRRREESFRWQANYDLIHAQILAYEVRLHEYCATLEYLGTHYKPPKDPKSNEWNGIFVARTRTDDKTSSLRTEAVDALKAVVINHAGTPYAARAQTELGRVFGFELREHYQPPSRPGSGKPIVLPKF